MSIGNITQTISTIPKAGARGVDVQSIFVAKQEDFQDHLQGTTVTELNTLKDQFNTRIGEINSTATTMNGYATSASSSASTATTKASEASNSASTATTKASEASNSASNSSYWETRANKWAETNYNVVVEAGKYSAKHWATEAQNVVLNKVNKVASTDNAIVRFNGTTGDVQNSNVIIDDKGNLLLTSGTGGLGYGIGAGGTVTQLTSKSTDVTLNKPSGQITMSSAALAAGAMVSFFLYNNVYSSMADIFNVQCVKDSNSDKYNIYAVNNGPGYGIVIYVKNISAFSLSDALIINFSLIKGATA